MADPTMTLLEYPRKVDVDLDGDFPSQGMRLLAQLQSSSRRSSRSVPAPRAEPGNPGGRDPAAHSEAAGRELVPEPLRVLPASRAGAVGHSPGGLGPGRQHPQGRRPGAGFGPDGIEQSKVSRICSELDEFVEAFRSRPLEGSYPYRWLHALYLTVHQDDRIVSQTLVVAIAVRETGDREIPGLALGQREEYAFWLDFLRSLVRCGLSGVQQVISDGHEGLKAAVEHALAGASWQRCRAHFMRKLSDAKPLLAAVPQPLTLAPAR